MTDMISKIKDWLNLGVLPLLGLLIFTSLFVFLPDVAISKIGLAEIKSKYSIYFGLCFIFSASFLVAAAIYKLWNIWIGPGIKQMANVYYLKKDAKSLTDEEKKLLRHFIENQTRSANLSLKDGVVLGLEQRKIIIRLGILGTDAYSMSFPFNIQPWAWEYFNKHRELLDME
jgi:hypothetical protein